MPSTSTLSFPHRYSGAAKRLALGGLLVCLSLGRALANETSDRIFALAEDKRNEFWTLYLQQSRRMCDTAVRSMFQGTPGHAEDVWSVACKDGNSYSIAIAPGPEGTTTLLSCDEALATDTMLLYLSGSKSDPLRCWKQISR